MTLQMVKMFLSMQLMLVCVVMHGLSVWSSSLALGLLLMLCNLSICLRSVNYCIIAAIIVIIYYL